MKFLIPKKTNTKDLITLLSNFLDFDVTAEELEDYKIILINDDLPYEVDIRLYLPNSATKAEIFKVCKDIILYYYI